MGVDIPKEHPEKRKWFGRETFKYFIASLVLGFAAEVATVLELTQKDEQRIAVQRTPMSEKELLSLMQQELEVQQIVYLSAQDAENSEEDATSSSAVHRTLGEIKKWFKEATENPIEKSEEISGMPEESKEWVEHYRTSRDKNLDDEKKDCNDYAERACELWQSKGLKSYMLATRPAQLPYALALKKWHLVSLLRVDNQRFIIVHNKNIIVWEGSLEEFITYQKNILAFGKDMQTVEFSGVVKYEPLKHHNCPIAKLLDQATRGTGSEKGIAICPLPQTPNHLAENENDILTPEIQGVASR